MLGVELADLIAVCIEGMKTQAEAIGLIVNNQNEKL